MFNNVFDLRADMDKNYQSFLINDAVFRLVEINNNEGLDFYGNKLLECGFFQIMDKVLTATRRDTAEKHVSEYALTIEGREKPMVFIAVERY